MAAPKKEKQLNSGKIRDIYTTGEIDGARRERMIDWITFFRRNPHRFVEQYFGIHLHMYQNLMLWVLQRSTLGYIVASRASAKTFIIAIWAMTLCVLYPGIHVIACSKTMKQGGLILDKLRQLMSDYPNVAREIKSITTNQNSYECIFHCGSSIKVVPSSESSRGNRASYIIIEESRLVSRTILEQVIKPFLEVRTPPYRLLPEYRNIPELKEEGIISYITSAGYTSEYWYQSVKTCIRRMMSGDEKSNFLAFDYLISVYHNIKTEEMIKNEMADNDSLTVQMEYLNIPSGTTGKAYFKPTMFPRNIKKAFYPQKLDTFNPKKNPYAIPKTDGEIRFLAVDVATRAGKKNDNTIMSCIRLIPSMGKGYERHLVYLESHKGENTVVQAGRVKDIFFDFEADYIILDLAQAGISLYDMMSQVTTNDDRGVQYPAFTVVDEHFDFVEDKLRKELRERTLGKSPIPVIFPIIANAGLNSQIAVALRNTLQKKLWNFLIPEGDAEEYMIRTNKEYTVDSMDADTTAFFNHPYVQTSLAIGECIALDLTLMNGQIKLVEKSGNYKDRFTTIAYANFIASQFDKELLKETEEKDDWGAIEAITMFI